jgi:hypothetical protein
VRRSALCFDPVDEPSRPACRFPAEIDHVDETRFVYQGFLFGHYDSRGGTTFVEAASKEEALRHYALVFGFEPEEVSEQLLRELHDEDFLCDAVIESGDLIEVGADLDGSMTGSFDPDSNEGVTAWIVGRSGDPECWLDSLPKDDSPLKIWYGSKPAEPTFAPRWDDDAFGLLFDRANVG